jgi:hypothetical protein
MNLYLIKRGPKPGYQKSPFHPVIICTRKDIAKDEAGATHDGATVWERTGHRDNGFGWLIVRWKGFDIDYGPIVGHLITLPDGTKTGFWRDYTDPQSIKDLLPGAVWWSDKPMPEWLWQRGVIYPPDKFTRQWVLNQVANDGFNMVAHDIPPHWTTESGEKAAKS